MFPQSPWKVVDTEVHEAQSRHTERRREGCLPSCSFTCWAHSTLCTEWEKDVQEQKDTRTCPLKSYHTTEASFGRIKTDNFEIIVSRWLINLYLMLLTQFCVKYEVVHKALWRCNILRRCGSRLCVFALACFVRVCVYGCKHFFPTYACTYETEMHRPFHMYTRI